jgi:integrase
VSSSLTLADAARIMREAVKDKSYRAFPMGGEVAAYLRWKRGQLTPASYDSYESILDKLVRNFCDLELSDFEPPVGVERIEEFLDHRCGESAAGTYNNYHAVLSDFFKWATLKDKLHGDPMRPILRRKKRDIHRTIFSDDDRTRILADGPDGDSLYRDRVALRLLLKNGIRKGSLTAIQFRHFDRSRRRLTVFAKGGKIRELPIVDEGLWEDLGNHMVLVTAEPDHYLVCSRKAVWRGYLPDGSSKFDYISYPGKPLSAHGMHNWWYGCLQRAGVAAAGQTSGEKMHKARHTAGQSLLDKTGNLKAVQKLLMHSDIATTGNIYTDWDEDRLAADLEGSTFGE